MGRWALTLLVINSTIGVGIFKLPSGVSSLLGQSAPAGYLIAALLVGVWVAVLAELASQFDGSGGQYLYTRTALGPFAGLQCGWFSWLTRMSAQAAIINAFIDYLREWWPGMDGTGRALVIAAMMGGLAAVNYRGIRGGVWFSNTITIAKLSTLALFILLGLVLAGPPAPRPAEAATSLAGWADALVILVYAFSGFENAPTSMGEAKSPRRDAAFALLAGMGIVTLCYLFAHIVCARAVPNLPASTLPFADATRSFAGPAGAKLIAAGVMLSAFGTVSAAFVTAPRLMFAMAERGELPAFFAAVHPRFRTPHVSVVIWALLVCGLALAGGFLWNAVLSVASRLITYALMCASLIALRRRAPTADAWRAPGGPALAGLGIAFCVVLATRFTSDHLLVIGSVAVIASTNWILTRPQPLD